MFEKRSEKTSVFKIVLIVLAVLAALAAIAGIICAIKKKKKNAACCEGDCDCDCDELFFDDEDFCDDVEVEIEDAIEA